jgi:peptidoglycan/LPS O-acetylase OafA/YrhL
MLIVTTPAALIVLLPTELSDYASSMIATTLWVANIYFWQTADYFGDAAGEVAPVV